MVLRLMQTEDSSVAVGKGGGVRYRAVPPFVHSVLRVEVVLLPLLKDSIAQSIAWGERDSARERGGRGRGGGAALENKGGSVQRLLHP